MSDKSPAVKYDAPPKLPRAPTIIRGSEDIDGDYGLTTSDSQTSEASDLHHGLRPGSLAPPPRFPSLIDISLPSAECATPVTLGVDRKQEVIANSSTNDQSQIASSIARLAVEPGSGERRAREAGAREWTPEDQEKFENFLRGDES